LSPLSTNQPKNSDKFVQATDPPFISLIFLTNHFIQQPILYPPIHPSIHQIVSTFIPTKPLLIGAFLKAHPTSPPGGGVQPTQGLGDSQQPFSSPGTPLSSHGVSKNFAALFMDEEFF